MAKGSDAAYQHRSPTYQIIDLDFEGHGDRPTEAEYSMDLFVKNVLQHLEDLNITQTNIFGYSMGGYVALKLALQNPTLVKRIVTLGTKFNWTKEIAAQEIRMLNPQKIEESHPCSNDCCSTKGVTGLVDAF